MMFTKYIGWIIVLVLLATFSSVIIKLLGWFFAGIFALIVGVMLLRFILRSLRPRRETRIYHIYTRR
jgi:hypothetical protein